MSAKHRLRNPRLAPRSDNTLITRRAARGRFIWTVVILTGVLGLAFWGWQASRSSRKSNWNDAQFYPATPSRPGGADSNRATVPTSASGARGDQVFITKVNRGSELLTQGKTEEALVILKEALQLNPDDEDVHYNLGLAYARLGKSEEAIGQYREALRIFPDYVEAHNNLGNLFARLGRNGEAIPHLEAAIKIMPDYASAHNNLGTALQRIGRTNEAYAAFKKAVEYKPDYWEAHLNIGGSALERGQLDEARTAFETVLRLRADFEPAKMGLAEVRARQRRNSATSPATNQP